MSIVKRLGRFYTAAKIQSFLILRTFLKKKSLFGTIVFSNLISQTKCKSRFYEQYKKGDRSLPKINYFCVAMYKQLTSEQRYAIKLGLQAKMTVTAIAQQICVSVSTVSREIKRNKNRNGGYSWANTYFGCSVFGDTWITIKLLVHVFYCLHIALDQIKNESII